MNTEQGYHEKKDDQTNANSKEKEARQEVLLFQGYCMRAKVEEESVCLEAGGSIVESCSDCK